MGSVTPKEAPSVCPVCGAYSLAPEAKMSVLLAVCDVLVMKALEKMGNYIVRAQRRRYNDLGDRPFHVAHTIWQVDDVIVSKALRGAWDVVPAVMSTYGAGLVDPVEESGKVVTALNQYVHDLVITGEAHNLEELAYRMHARLNLPVYVNHEGVGHEPEAH